MMTIADQQITPLQAWDHETARKAYHEAGHAVGSRAIGCRVTSLSLDGATSMIPLLDDGEMTDSGRRRFATIAFCGPIAEQRYARLTGDECNKLWLDGAAWCGDGANIAKCALDAAHLAKARERAVWLMQTHWRKVQALAPILMERGSLSGDEVNEILRNVLFF